MYTVAELTMEFFPEIANLFIFHLFLAKKILDYLCNSVVFFIPDLSFITSNCPNKV